MFARHPHPPQPHQPFGHPPQSPGEVRPHPPAYPQGERRNPTPMTENDYELLRELLGDDQKAQALSRMLQNSPPEIAALGDLVLRVFERTRSI